MSRREIVTGTFRVRQADGRTATIEEVTIMVDDPTLTGTLWNAPQQRLEILRLADGGGWVTDNEDGTLRVDNSGECLTRC
jgi:hypothetical protein